MNLALCYENVLPARGGCETYIADLSRRLVVDGHEVHLYACRWDAEALPSEMKVHPVKCPVGPRFLRPWRFGAACQAALRDNRHLVSIGFDKTGFARFVGHKVSITGQWIASTQPPTLRVSNYDNIKIVSDICAPPEK